MRRAILLLTLAACEAPAPTTPILSVLRRTETCFATMTPDNPVPSELDVANLCDEPVLPTMYASVDLVEVVIDYGPDVDFAVTTVAPRPEVAISVDGTPAAIPVAISDEQRVGARAYYLATFRAPALPSVDVRVGAGISPGFWTESSTVFSVVPPPISFDLAECVGGLSCAHTGAVGAVHARVAVPGGVELPVSIHQTIDQIAMPDPVPATNAVPASNESIANIAIEVPSARPGALWALSAQIGASTSAPIVIALDPPKITTSLPCGTNCVVPRGGSVGLAIDTFADIHPQRALVTTKVGGVPQLVAAEVELVQGFGLLTLVAPTNAVGTWQIDVTVAGYPAETIEAHVQ